MGDEAGAFELEKITVGMGRDGASRLIEKVPGPPPRIDGLTISAYQMTESAPHGGEMHPDGDELLYVVSGRIDVILEQGGGERVVEIGPGQACIVPKGVWHRVAIREPCHLVHLTPGPGGEHRPL